MYNLAQLNKIIKKMNKPSDSLPKLIGIKEAAEMLSVHPATLRRWDKENKLEPIIISKRGDRRYRLEDIIKFIENKK